MDELLEDGIHTLQDDQGNLDRWNSYVHKAPTASFYHRFEWKSVTESEFQHEAYYLASSCDGKVDGILPLVLLRSRLFGRILCSLPFVNYCGPSANSSAVESALLARAYEIAREEGVDYLELRALHVCDEDLPQSQSKISMTVPLVRDPDVLWNAFKSKHRNNIRRVYKNGLSIRSGHDDMLDVFYDLMCHSWRDLGTPIYRKQYFRSILETFGNQVRIFVAYQGTTPVATAFNGYSGSTVEGMWAGTPLKYRNLQSNYILYWEMIKHACEEGYEHFHLGRSTVESGGESFKRKWGADSKQLYWQYYLPDGGDIPQLNVNNPKYTLAISIWRRMPLWLTKAAGPLLARSIP